MNRQLLAAVALSAAVLPIAVPVATPAYAGHPLPGAPKCHSAAPSDFNGDGRSDLAVSAPGAKDYPATSGDVTIFSGGLRALDYARTLTAEHGPDITATYPQFGAATATGDFNGDHCADLVVLDGGGRLGTYRYGGPSSPVAKPAYGAAAVFYGHPTADKTDPFSSQQGIGAYSVRGIGTSCDASSGCPVNLEPVVATGDLNGDRRADLLMAAATAIGGDGLAYELTEIPGTKTGLHPGSARTLPLGTTLFPGTEVTSVIRQIAVGDINHDGYADAAVAFTGGADDLPGVDVLYGSRRGLGKARASQLWNRSRAGVPGLDSAGGSISIALGDFRGNGHDDLSFAESGSATVTVVYGTATGLATKHLQTWSKSTSGVRGSSTSGDRWGSTLVAGRFGIGKYDDLVVADASTEQISVLRGSRVRGVIAKGNLLWDQDTDGIPGQREVGNRWSSAMTVGYFGHGLGEDLAVGAPGANNERGTMTVLYGSKTSGVGLRTSLAQPLLKPAVNGTPAQPGDGFGAVLPTG